MCGAVLCDVSPIQPYSRLSHRSGWIYAPRTPWGGANHTCQAVHLPFCVGGWGLQPSPASRHQSASPSSPRQATPTTTLLHTPRLVPHQTDASSPTLSRPVTPCQPLPAGSRLTELRRHAPSRGWGYVHVVESGISVKTFTYLSGAILI